MCSFQSGDLATSVVTSSTISRGCLQGTGGAKSCLQIAVTRMSGGAPPEQIVPMGFFISSMELFVRVGFTEKLSKISKVCWYLFYSWLQPRCFTFWFWCNFSDELHWESRRDFCFVWHRAECEGSLEFFAVWRLCALRHPQRISLHQSGEHQKQVVLGQCFSQALSLSW